MAVSYVSIADIDKLFRPLKAEEKEKAETLIEVVTDSLRMEATKAGRDLDEMVISGQILPSVLKSVIADVVGRTLMTSTDSEPMTQVTQSALGYSVSGSFLVPGGGLFIKKSELARLGLRRQRIGMVNIYGCDD